MENLVEIVKNFDTLSPQNREMLLVFSRGMLASQKNSSLAVREQYGLDKEPPKGAA
jgi:hypothetical protein